MATTPPGYDHTSIIAQAVVSALNATLAAAGGTACANTTFERIIYLLALIGFAWTKRHHFFGGAKPPAGPVDFQTLLRSLRTSDGEVSLSPPPSPTDVSGRSSPPKPSSSAAAAAAAAGGMSSPRK